MEWNDLFEKIKTEKYSKTLNTFLDNEYQNYVVYPARDKIFDAYKLTPLDKVKVVIIGQDPYHEKGQAMGLAFSVPKGVILPPSLENIYKEIEIEFKNKMNHQNGDLRYLSSQGVLLVNPILTVREHLPLSHKCLEYDLFFKEVLQVLNSQNQPIVFMLWGNNAKVYKNLLSNPNHLILEACHPSPLSANRGGWFNTNNFINCNEYLIKHNLEKINWINF